MTQTLRFTLLLLIAVSAIPSEARGEIRIDTDRNYTITVMGLNWRHCCASPKDVVDETISLIQKEIPAKFTVVDLGLYTIGEDNIQSIEQLVQIVYRFVNPSTSQFSFFALYTSTFFPDFQGHNAVGLAIISKNQNTGQDVRMIVMTGVQQNGSPLTLKALAVATGHEIGHLWGFQHEDKQGCIMSSTLTLSRTSFRQCEQFPAGVPFPPNFASSPSSPATGAGNSSLLVVGLLGALSAIIFPTVIVAVWVARRENSTTRPSFNPMIQSPFQLSQTNPSVLYWNDVHRFYNGR